MGYELSIAAQRAAVQAALGVPLARAYQDETAALLALSPSATDADADAIDDLIYALKTAGVWAKSLALYMLACPDAALALSDWKSPSGALGLAAVNSPTFRARKGYRFDGVSSHLLGPTFTALGYQQNDHAAALWTLHGGACVQSAMATDASGQNFLLGSNTGTSLLVNMRSGSNTIDTVDAYDGTGLVGFSRLSAGSFTAYVNRRGKNVVRTTASVPTSAHLTFGRINTTYEVSETAFGGIFLGLTSTEWSALYEAVAAYLSAIGAISQADGAWSWFSDPRAISLNGDVVAGAMDSGGSSVVIKFDKDLEPKKTTLIRAFERDDHDAGSLLIRESDSRLLAFTVKHTGAKFMQSVSKFPLDATQWEPAVDIASQLAATGATYAYAAPFYLPGEAGKIIMFFRGGPSGAWTWCYSTSDDGGETWSAAVAMFPYSAARPYSKYARNGDSRIDIVCNDGHPSETPLNSTYHYFYDAGAWKKSNGDALDAFPITPGPATLTRIWDGTAGNGRSWINEVVIDPTTGRPVVSFNVYPSTSDHRIYQSRWSGSAWNNVQIATGGLQPNYLYLAEAYYAGGMATDPLDVNVVYISRNVAGVFQLFRYVSPDNGATWPGEQLTFGTEHCIRPFFVAGTRTLLYCKGRYTTFADYNMAIEAMDVSGFTIYTPRA